MNKHTTKYVIECRNKDGGLSFGDPQPWTVFGAMAMTGIDADEMAKRIFRHKPDAILDGRYITEWPALIDPRWSARRKTW